MSTNNGQMMAALPAVDGDFYQIADLLSDEDRALLGRVRAFMEAQVAPVINGYWTRAAFPFDILPGFRDLGIVGTCYQGYGCPGKSTLLDGFISMELARVDPSIATFYGVHSGLAMGSIYRPCAWAGAYQSAMLWSSG